MQTNIGIGIATKASDLAQAQEGFVRLGMSADEAGKRVQAIAESAKTTGGKVESALVSAVASVNRFATAAESGSSRAGRAGEQAALQVERLQQAIEDAKAEGAPVSETAIATLKQLDSQLDKNVQKVGEMKRVQEDTRRAIDDATRAQGGLGQGVTTTADLLGVFNDRWEQMALRVGVGIAAVKVAAGTLRELSSAAAEVASSLGASDEAVAKFRADMDQIVAVMENPLRIFGLIISKSREALAAMAETAVGSGVEVSSDLAARNEAAAQRGIALLADRKAMLVDVLGDSEKLARSSEALLAVFDELGSAGPRNGAQMAAIFAKALELDAGLQRLGKNGSEAWRDLVAAASQYEQQQKAQGDADREAERERKRAADEAKRDQDELATHWRKVTDESAAIYENQRKTMELAAAKTRDYVQSLKQVGPELRQFNDRIEQLKLALASGLLDETAFREALAGYVAELNAAAKTASEEILAKFQFEPTGGKPKEKPSAAAVATAERLKEARREADLLVGLGRALENSFGGTNDQLELAVAGIGRMIEGLGQAKAATDEIGRSDAFGMMAQGIMAVAEATGLLQRNVTRGGFGGRGEGNYASEGSAVGSVVGAIIGAYFSNPQAGMAIGSAAGGILGSFIQKGAEEALAVSVDGINGIGLQVTKSEGALGKVLSDIGYAVNQALLTLMDSLGATIEDLPEVTAKVRDGVITMIVGGVKGKFKEMDDAIQFALTELLKQGDITGLSDTMRRILERTQAPDLSALTADLEFGQWYERLGLAEAGVAFLDAMASFRTKLRKATEFGLDLEPVYQDLARNLGNIRNQILGITETDEERIRRQAAAFNAQALLFMAEQEAKKADLEVQRATLAAKVELMRADAGMAEQGLQIAEAEARIKRTRLGLDAEYIGAGYQLLDAEYDLYQDKLGLELGAINELAQALYQLGVVTDAIAAIDDVLSSIQLISPGEIDAAIGRLGSGSGGGGGVAGPSPADQLADFNKQLADLRRESMPDFLRRLAELRDKFAGLRATATELGQTTEELDRIEQQRLDTLRAEIQGQIRDRLRGGGDAAGWQTELDNLGKWLASTVDALAALGEDPAEAIAAYQASLAELRDSILSSLSPTFALQKRFSDLSRTLDWVAQNAEQLGISEEELARIRSETGTSMFLDLAERMAQAIGDEEALAALQRLRWQMELVQYKLEIERLAALGLLTKEQIEMLYALLGQALVFDPTGTTGGDLTPEQAAYWAAIRQQEAADMMAEAARRLQDAVDALIDFQRSLFLSNLSPLTPQQRLDEATQQAQSLVNQILAMGANDTRRPELMQQLPDLLRAYLTELGAVWGTASSQYAAGFAW